MTRRELLRRLIILVVAIGLLGASPAAAARRVEIEVVLLVDTSDSMYDELRAMCQGIDELTDGTALRGVKVIITVMAIAETRGCASEEVTQLFPEGQVRDREDWGPAVTDVARFHTWSPGAARLIIALSDEGPLNGDPVDDKDEQSIRLAIRAAQANDVAVSSVLGTEFNREMEPLARRLADQTHARVYVSKDPADDLIDGLSELILNAVEQARSPETLLQAIPTPDDIVFDGEVVSLNLALAFLCTLVLGVAFTVTDNTLAVYRDSFDDSSPGRLLGAAVKTARAVERIITPGDWSMLSERPRRLLASLQLVFFLALMALLGMFLEPGLDLASRRGLSLWIGILLALVFLSFVNEGTQLWFLRRAGARPLTRLRPGALLATLATVLVSRACGLLPGFFYGRATFIDQPRDEKSGLGQRRRARAALIGLVATGVMGLLLWILVIPVSGLMEWVDGLDSPTTWGNLLTGLLDGVQGFLLLSFFLGWQTLLFEMLPLPSSAGGGILFRRNRWVWALLAVLLFFVLLQTILNPFGTSEELLENRGVLFLGALAFLFSFAAVVVWLYFAFGAGGETSNWGRDQHTTVLAISLIVIWILGACAGITTLALGWLR